jgi:multidrug efflux pump
MSGIIGRLFREFAVTLSVAIIISMVVSLTSTPMLCALLLKEKHEGERGWLYRSSEWVFDSVLAAYERALRFVLRHSWATLLVTLSTVALTVYLYMIVPKGFFPQQDTGRLTGNLIADQDTSFQTMTGLVRKFAAVVSADPAVESAVAYTGGRGASNAGRMYITLKPLADRGVSADAVVARIRAKASKLVGASLFLQAVQDLRVGGRSSSAQYQYTLRGSSLDELNEWSPKLLEEMRKIPGINDVNTDQQTDGLQTRLVIDRLTAARLGISFQAIDNTLYDAFGQRQVSTMYRDQNQYRVVMELDEEYSGNPKALQDIYVSSASATVPLTTLYRSELVNTSLSVPHSGQFPSVTLSFNLQPGTALGDIVPQVEDLVVKIGLPQSIQGNFQGTAQAFQDSLSNQPFLILAAVVTVYIVLGILYESYIHPLTILSTLPSAGVGALLALMVCGVELNVMALIGILLLIGIVKKNAIMMIDFALEAERTQGLSTEESIFQACILRFRPITMTTMAALLGGLPLAMGFGEGAELRRPLGIAIVGGLVFSQALTLFTTPVVYLFLDRLRRREPADLHHPIAAETTSSNDLATH